MFAKESDEDIQQMFDDLASGNLLVEDLEDLGYEKNGNDFYGMDWDYQDEDDWWTMRKGGFDVTYDQEVIDKAEPLSKDEEFKKTTIGMIPLGRLGEVKDLMGPFGFLASEASSLMTGSSILVDGGWTAR